ncbi:ABC transporter ATP-binding protein [Notoacmeibacter sp. MSK16QG-6]|uniref:ABC transporter ATP-binding protein n=1 Tax=Notoacmeibacter sp. MSK16QG-6 TaxID=2957982 RepID=UPI00209FE8DB|nr:ABC transporter ATP-binding protein [Notoacmeibacter sp. MSK16QG-6]MCP1199753.1 ABC transporter ATP-binding protein [Notoacmeibacter sp. MSK16QG-6]
MLSVEGLTKRFGTLVANDAVDLVIKPGEIHALLGENGAGKSTFVKMLFGSLRPDAGVIRWEGNPVSIETPGEARALGIGMVFQHFSLFEALTAGENIALAFEGGGTGHGAIGARAREVSETYGLPIDPDALVGELSVGERQRIEIVRCLMQDPKLIILDEPTSVLTPQEAEKLFETLERLKSEGRSVLYISHRLDEVRRLCDSATVLRHGRVVAHCTPSEETAGSLAAMMVGEEVEGFSRASAAVDHASDRAVLRLNGLSLPAASPFAVPLKDIDLTVPAGMVIGIAGVAGNGQGELFEALSGEVLQNRADMVSIDGSAAGHMDIEERRALGAAFVPEERLGHGAAPAMALTDNLFLSRHGTDSALFTGTLGSILKNKLKAVAAHISETMDVRKGAPDPHASALSGGNLQKYLVGRELDREPLLIIVNQPTWGVDAGAAARIRGALANVARRGGAVLAISQDLDELFEIADAIAVMHHGRMSRPIPIEEATREKIGLLMGGADPDHAELAEMQA